MSVGIVFTQAARRKLRTRLARRLAADRMSLEAKLREIEHKLKQVFPNGRAVVVQDLHSGFRERSEELILLVELTESADDDGVYVVKLGPESKLAKELAGWRDCRPAGLRHDLVLMTVEERREEVNGSLIALVYTDAQQLIGVDETIHLEKAMLDGALLGVPTPASVADALFQLYERLGLLMYRTSYVDDPAHPGYQFLLNRLDQRLDENLQLWEAESGPAFDCLTAASTFTDMAPFRQHFRDPASFFRYLARISATNASLAASLVPRILRGHGHGDLHGRNVLVGRVGDRILWPAVFDYGDMGRDNIIAWDFVKMETEFKIRAYPRVFSSVTTVPTFVPEVLAFEKELFEKTEECRNSCRWPASSAAATPRDRLGWLLLRLRQLADTHLGTNLNRSRDWLTEYYFLLAVYGLNSVRFHNLTSIEFLGAYLSAGTACARFLYDREALAPAGVTAP
ncbi:MAG TPA: hypothetical protein VGY66_06135 [Gemmataceae bacterium]|nr:hypothetical protein [Gemmataceae bacterium]